MTITSSDDDHSETEHETLEKAKTACAADDQVVERDHYFTDGPVVYTHANPASDAKTAR